MPYLGAAGDSLQQRNVIGNADEHNRCLVASQAVLTASHRPVFLALKGCNLKAKIKAKISPLRRNQQMLL